MIDKIATTETVVNVAIATTYPGATLMCSSIKAEIIDETKDVNSDKRRFLFMSNSFLVLVVETGVSSQTHDQTTIVSARDIRTTYLRPYQTNFHRRPSLVSSSSSIFISCGDLIHPYDTM